MTERVLRRLARKCAEAEEAGNMLKQLLKKGVGVAWVEAFSVSNVGRKQAKTAGEKGRIDVVKEEMQKIVSSSKCKLRDIKSRKK